jgi:hypothetical protein
MFYHIIYFRATPLTKPKSEMTPEELAKREEEEFSTGPLSVLTQSVKNNTQVKESCALFTINSFLMYLLQVYYCT